MTAYYNEHDQFAAAWLRELIRVGEIAPGEVDERSIEDVVPADLAGFVQCHFFAGIGVWSYALRCAGWPDDRPVWTGSCPCQPFSAAGKGRGFADERHLWPAFHHLIAVCGPELVFGEQVAGKDGLAWLDLVAADLEAMGYACGAVPFPAAGVGAPHIRERLYWVADRDDAGLEGWRQPGRERAAQRPSGPRGMAGGMADTRREYGVGRTQANERPCAADPGEWGKGPVHHKSCGISGGVADCHKNGRGARDGIQPIRTEHHAEHGGRSSGLEHTAGDGRQQRRAEPIWRGLVGGCSDGRPGPVNGIWRDADWLGCRDGRWRPVEPGSFPLVDGSAARVGRLRGYGNGLVAPQAQAFIESYIDVTAAAQWAGPAEREAAHG